MKIEIIFDPAKDKINIAKHGLSLQEFSELDFTEAVFVPDKRFDYGEDRMIVLAPLEGRICVGVYTMIQGLWRVISLRKANLREVRLYHEAKQDQ